MNLKMKGLLLKHDKIGSVQLLTCLFFCFLFCLLVRSYFLVTTLYTIFNLKKGL